MTLNVRRLVIYVKGNFMHKLLYTAAIPLLVSNTMAMEFTDAVSEGNETNLLNRIASLAEPQASQSVAIGTGNDEINPAYELRQLTLSDPYMIPNLASIGEEETPEASGAASPAVFENKISQPKNLHLTENARGIIPFTINPDRTISSANTPFDQIDVRDEASLTLNLIFAPGPHAAGTVSYVVANLYTGNMPQITIENQHTDGLNGLSVITELAPTEEGSSQLTLKLTISEAFSVTETTEDNSELLQPETVADDSSDTADNTHALVAPTGDTSVADASEYSEGDDFQTSVALETDASAETQEDNVV